MDDWAGADRIVLGSWLDEFYDWARSCRLKKCWSTERVTMPPYARRATKLGWMAWRIDAEPLTKEFANELEDRTIPDTASAHMRRKRHWIRG